LEALAYWKKHLQAWQDTHLVRIKQAAGLLNFSADTKLKTYQVNLVDRKIYSARADTRAILQRLYSDQRWCLLTQAFRRAIYTLHSLPHLPLLHYALSAGLTALKLPACITEEPHSSQPSHLSELPFSSSNAMLSSSDLRSGSPSRVPLLSNPNCPVCDTACLGVLAHEVPFSHHANSTIVCRMSGKIMTADNPPLAFENGMVYSEQVSFSDILLMDFVSDPFTNIGTSGDG
jgi:macrophage erythroblast attacher